MLRELMLGGHPLTLRCVRLLEQFGTTEQTDAAIAESADSALSRDEFARVQELLHASPASFNERAGDLLASTLARLGYLEPGVRNDALAVAWELVAFADESQRLLVASRLREQILDSDPDSSLVAIALAQEIAGRPKSSLDLVEIIVAAAERVNATPADSFQELHLLRFLCMHSAALPPGIAERLREHLTEILEQRPSLVAPICEMMSAVPEEELGERAGFARTAFDASATGELDQRLLLLTTARTLAANTAVEPEVRQYITSLGSSEDAADSQLYASLED
jgi:hypothetical protein